METPNEHLGKRFKVIELSPIIKAHGIKLNEIGIAVKNSFPSKYDYCLQFPERITISGHLVKLFFYKDELELVGKE